MTVEEAIKLLSKLPKDDELIVGWWEYEYMQEAFPNLSKEVWGGICDKSWRLDWSDINRQIDDLTEEEEV